MNSSNAVYGWEVRYGHPAHGLQQSLCSGRSDTWRGALQTASRRMHKYERHVSDYFELRAYAWVWDDNGNRLMFERSPLDGWERSAS